MSDMPKNIYALLVGINAYKLPGAKLNGCVRDVASMTDYLKEFCKTKNINLHLDQPLLDGDAKRQAIIDGFQHFKAATEEDACIFYYSGHGAFCDVPDEFRDLEPNQHIETLVCVDSRISAYDLADKELRWLIWQATKNKPNMSFLSIIDCCHSGGVTRELFEPETKVKHIEEIEKVRDFTAFLGYEDYSSIAYKRTNLPKGNNVFLAASNEYQIAKEAKVNNQSVGVFTYFLLKFLREHKAKISYQDLINKIDDGIKNAKIKDQTPMIVATDAQKKQHFLNRSYQTTEAENLLNSDTVVVGIATTCSNKTRQLVENLFEEETSDYTHFKLSTAVNEVTYLIQERDETIFLSDSDAPNTPLFPKQVINGGRAVRDFLLQIEAYLA